MMWSTWCDSARRLNFDRTWSASLMASGVSAVPSRPPAPEPHHLLLAVDHLKRQIRLDLHDDHVQRVRADVYGGQAHDSVYHYN